MRRSVAALVVACLLVAAPAGADDKDAAAREAFRLGQADEAEQRYDAALGHYRDVLRIDPGNWFAGTAKARIDALSPYEGAFAELGELDAVRKDPRRASDVEVLDGLAALVAPWPDGRVKQEAQVFLAAGYLRLGQTARGVDLALSLARNRAADPFLRDAAWDLAWSGLQSLGELDRAGREIAGDDGAPSALRARVRRELRRRTLHRVSYAVAGVGAALFVVAGAVVARRGRVRVALRALLRPASLVFLATVPLVGSVIAERWEHGAGRPFGAFGVALLLVHALVSASRGAFGDRRGRVRAAAAIVAGACVLAAAYLVLERAEAAGVPLLSDFGL